MSQYTDLLNKMIREKEQAEAEEAKHVKPLSKAEAQSEREFLSQWLRKGTVPMNRAYGNFFIPGTNRNRGSIYKPARLVQLVKAGVLRKVNDNRYELV